jgi:hypothetical protein
MIKNIGIIQAIKAINPDAQVIVYGEDYDTIDWNAGTVVISKADIDAKIVELEAEWTAQEYARNRASEYPSLLELTVALYDDADKEALVAKRNAVKLKYPKPS